MDSIDLLSPPGRVARVRFVSGTLLIEGAPAARDQLVWDEAAGCARAPAHLFGEIAARADADGVVLDGDLRAAWTPAPRSIEALSLRPYQEQALANWELAGKRGVVALPTGAGKTRVALAAILSSGVPSVVLCPTRALLAAWASELGAALGERIGIVGDGEQRVERVTVMTFESAYRRLDQVGDRFGLLVVDEVHHFASGARSEALEACAAAARLGLSATAPPAGSEGEATLRRLVGPVVIEVTVEELAGTHLAELTRVRVPVDLEPEEREAYERLVQPLTSLRRRYFWAHRRATYDEMLRDTARTAEGRSALRDWAEGLRIACFPRAKRRLVGALLERHRSDRTIVFTARVEDAYAIAERSLIPVIAGDVGAAERERILARFRDGRIRAIASARVLNEGIDVPDARVALIASGSLGVREHVQRIGRVLRPAPGKRALVYELVTRSTVDERMSEARGRASDSSRHEKDGRGRRAREGVDAARP